MFYTLSKIHPDDRRGMAQVRALLEQEGHVNGALKTTKKLLEAVPQAQRAHCQEFLHLRRIKWDETT